MEQSIEDSQKMVNDLLKEVGQIADDLETRSEDLLKETVRVTADGMTLVVNGAMEVELLEKHDNKPITLDHVKNLITTMTNTIRNRRSKALGAMLNALKDK